MRIDGKVIAERIVNRLTEEVAKCKEKGRVPTLAVILVGDSPASLAYITQKRKAAERIGATLVLKQFPPTISKGKIIETIQQWNDDPSIHGLIIQRPLPKELGDVTSLLASVPLEKDVDGFLPNSPFTPPVALAVLEILKEVFTLEKSRQKEQTFDAWLKNQCSVVFGRGETAGKPIAEVLESHGCTIEVIHSKTEHPEELTKKIDIIVSCVGKERVIKADMVTPRSVLIGVGMWRDGEGKLRGDYNEDEIKDIVAYYTPTPGGVGPVNVAFLMQNLVKAYTMNV